MLLTKTFSPDQYRDALESWAWIGIEGKTPLLSSLFGDTFLQDGDGYWFLDTMEGSLTQTWTRRDEVQAALDSEEGQDRYLLGGLAMAADRNGLVLGPNDVYDLVPPPVLGGSFDVANLTVADFVVAVNIAGQLHEQVRSLPPGTAVSGVSLHHGEPSQAPSADVSRRGRWRRKR